jgi:hypothetical protein
MHQTRFTVEIARTDFDPKHHDLWRAAAALLCERTYDGVFVRADWTRMLSAEAIVRMEVEVRGDADPREFPSRLERFFHDCFLMLNLSLPGSFGGVIVATVIAGGEFRVNELAFDASLFLYASAGRLPLASVVNWFDGRGRGSEGVLFHLLHIARSSDELAMRLRLAMCLELIGLDEEARRLDVRKVPVLHPLDEADDIEGADAIDRAAHLVIAALQEDVRR